MASSGGLTQIFKKPLPDNLSFIESLSPEYQIRPPVSLPVTPALEFFGELNFFTKKPEPHCVPLPPSSDHTAQSDPGDEKGWKAGLKKLRSFESLPLCMEEGVGFESSGSVDDDETITKSNADADRRANHPRNKTRYQRSCSDVTHRNSEGFPPPISCISKSGKPWIHLRPYRNGGMLVLKEFRVGREKLLHTTREDGRLRMHFMQPDEGHGEEGGNQVEEQDKGHEKQREERDQEKKDTGLLNVKKRRKILGMKKYIEWNSANYPCSIKDPYINYHL